MAIYGNKSRRLFEIGLAFATLALVVLVPVSTRADLISADTANAMPGWYKSVPIQFDESSGNNIDGSIDYAVYAPGQFDLSFPAKIRATEPSMCIGINSTTIRAPSALIRYGS